MPAVRPAADDELAGLAAVEEASSALFAEAGLALPPDYITVDELKACEVVLVSPGPDGKPVGFAAVESLDGGAHLWQLSVDPAYGRQGRGRGLLAAVIGRARRSGLPTVTLTTFRDVAWNGPFYRRYGFVELADADLAPGLKAHRDQEIAVGLDAISPRCAMCRPLFR
jgi:ribosomal protein S18 acetylase RimI-like enzyme